MRTAILLVTIAAALLTGCQEYEVDVTVAADGGGTRHVTLVSDSKVGDEGSLDREEFMTLFAIDPVLAWVREDLREIAAADSSWLKFGRKRPLAHRNVTVGSLDEWHENSGDITIRAWPSGKLGGVKFSNAVSVETGETATGRSITYRETFTWTGLREAIAQRQSREFEWALEEMYPRLSDSQRGEIRGIVKGAMLMEIDLALREAEPEEHETLVDTITDFVMAVLDPERPERGRELVRELTHRILVDPESELTDWIEEEMPGVDLAVMTDVALRVTMPGEITDSNADDVNGNTATWTLDVTETILRPAELFVRAEVPR